MATKPVAIVESKEEEKDEEQDTADSLTLEEYKQQNEELRKQLDLMRRENAKLRTMMPSKHQLQTDEFWKRIERRVTLNDVQYIKSLIKEQTLNMFDCNKLDQTLLLLSSKHGSSELTQLCLQFGADVSHRDSFHQTALDYARDNCFYHIESLLLCSSFNPQHVDSVHAESQEIHSQSLMIEAIVDALSIHKSNEKLFRIMFVDVMTTVIDRKLPFSDDMLLTAWHFVEHYSSSPPLHSKLWQSLEAAIKSVVESGTPMDWYWLNTFVVPSHLWYGEMLNAESTGTHSVDGRDKRDGSKSPKSPKASKSSKTPKSDGGGGGGRDGINGFNEKTSRKEGRCYLYHRLLAMMVNVEATKQVFKLEQNIALLANQDAESWNTLVQWTLNGDLNGKKSNHDGNHPNVHVRRSRNCKNLEFEIKQNRIPDGLRPEYTASQLASLAVMSRTAFDVHRHYDHHEYLSKLILLAESVDTEFHAVIQRLFAIDSVTNNGTVTLSKHPVIGAIHHVDGNHENDGKESKDSNHGMESKLNSNSNHSNNLKPNQMTLKYVRKSVPSLSEAQHRVDTQYRNETYPVTANCVDLNQCILIFDTVSNLLSAVHLLIETVDRNQCGITNAVIGASNGYRQYLKRKGFAALRLNVMIKGPHHSIIGSVDFVLHEMWLYQQRTKHLDLIRRRKVMMEQVAPRVLPQCLDQSKLLLMAGNRGDIKTLHRLMAINKSSDFLLSIEPNSGESVLCSLCRLNHFDALQFVMDQTERSLFVDRLFYSNKRNINPIEALFHGSCSVALCTLIFGINEVINRYRTVQSQLFRLIITLYTHYDPQIIAFITSKLEKAHFVLNFDDDANGIGLNGNGDGTELEKDTESQKTPFSMKNEMRKFLKSSYRYPKPERDFYRRDCITFFDQTLAFNVIATGQIEAVQSVTEQIGEWLFMKNVIFGNDDSSKSNDDHHTPSPLEWLLFRGVINSQSVDPHLDPKSFRNCTLEMVRYLLSSGTVKEALHFGDDDKLRVDRLHRIVYWMVHRRVDHVLFDEVLHCLNLDDGMNPDVLCKVIAYSSTDDIIKAAIRSNNLTASKKLIFIVGDGPFIERLFESDHLNVNTVEYAIWKSKVQTVEFLFSIKQIVDRILNDDETMFRTVFWSIWKFDAAKYSVIQRALSIDDHLIRKLMRYKSLRPLTFGEKAKTYWDRSIATVAITGNGGMERMKMIRAVDGAIFCDEVFHGNRNNLNPLEFLIRNQKLESIRYLLSLNEIKMRLQRDEEVMFRAIYWMFKRFEPAVIECFESALGKEHFAKVVVSLIKFKPTDPQSVKLRISSTTMNGDGDETKENDGDSLNMKMAVIESQQFSAKCFKYWTMNFVHSAVSHSLSAVQCLIDFVGKDLFCGKLLDRDEFNVNALEFASAADPPEVLQLLLDLDAPNVVQMVTSNELECYRLLCHCCRFGSDDAYKMVIERFGFDSEHRMKAMVEFEYPRNEDDRFEDSKFTQRYYDKTLLSWAILGGKAKRVRSVLPFYDKEEVMKVILKPDAIGRRPFVHIVRRKKYSLALQLLRAVADTENQLKLIALCSAELNDSTIQLKFEQMIVEQQRQNIQRKQMNKREGE